MLLLIVIVLVYIVIAGVWAALIQNLGKFSPLDSEEATLCGALWPITMPYMCAKYVVEEIIWNVLRKIAEREKDRRDNP